MSTSTRCAALFTATVVAAIVLCQLTVLGQEGRGGRGGEGRQGGQASNLPEAPPIGFFGSYRVAGDKTDPSKLPLLRACRINFNQSDPSLKLPNLFNDSSHGIHTSH